MSERLHSRWRPVAVLLVPVFFALAAGLMVRLWPADSPTGFRVAGGALIMAFAVLAALSVVLFAILSVYRRPRLVATCLVISALIHVAALLLFSRWIVQQRPLALAGAEKKHRVLSGFPSPAETRVGREVREQLIDLSVSQPQPFQERKLSPARASEPQPQRVRAPMRDGISPTPSPNTPPMARPAKPRRAVDETLEKIAQKPPEELSARLVALRPDTSQRAATPAAPALLPKPIRPTPPVLAALAPEESARPRENPPAASPNRQPLRQPVSDAAATAPAPASPEESLARVEPQRDVVRLDVQQKSTESPQNRAAAERLTPVELKIAHTALPAPDKLLKSVRPASASAAPNPPAVSLAEAAPERAATRALPLPDAPPMRGQATSQTTIEPLDIAAAALPPASDVRRNDAVAQPPPRVPRDLVAQRRMPATPAEAPLSKPSATMADSVPMPSSAPLTSPQMQAARLVAERPQIEGKLTAAASLPSPSLLAALAPAVGLVQPAAHEEAESAPARRPASIATARVRTGIGDAGAPDARPAAGVNVSSAASDLDAGTLVDATAERLSPDTAAQVQADLAAPPGRGARPGAPLDFSGAIPLAPAQDGAAAPTAGPTDRIESTMRRASAGVEGTSDVEGRLTPEFEGRDDTRTEAGISSFVATQPQPAHAETGGPEIRESILAPSALGPSGPATVPVVGVVHTLGTPEALQPTGGLPIRPRELSAQRTGADEEASASAEPAAFRPRIATEGSATPSAGSLVSAETGVVGGTAAASAPDEGVARLAPSSHVPSPDALVISARRAERTGRRPTVPSRPLPSADGTVGEMRVAKASGELETEPAGSAVLLRPREVTSSGGPAEAAPARLEVSLSEAPLPRSATSGDVAPVQAAEAVHRALLSMGSTPAPESVPEKAIYQMRSPDKRKKFILELGGTPATESAVEQALAWLKRAQSDDGRWDLRDFKTVRECGGGGDLEEDAAATGLALLAFLGAGYTHLDGAYRDTVKKGLEWLLDGQGSDGDLRRGGTMYGQALGAAALCESCSLTGDARLLEPAQNSIGFIIAAQNPENGWRYQPREDNDTSVTGWQILALKSAQIAGIKVPEQAFQWTGLWLDKVRKGNEGGLYAYKPGHAVTPVMTAEGWFCQLFMGEQARARGQSVSIAYLMQQVPRWSPETRAVHLYYWYYATLALHLSGAPEFERWNAALTDSLLKGRVKKGPAAGSWDPVCQLGPRGGRVYMTAMGALCLEVYYRFMPFYKQQHAATPASDRGR